MIKKFTAGNGIRVLCEQMEQIRSVVVGVWIGAGSRHERDEYLGVSHFIEHMLFKGTQKRTARQIAEEIDYIGGHINAFTAKDCTCFYVKTLDGHLRVGIDMLADILLHSKLEERDVNLEKNVILEEINMYEDTPDELVHDLLAETVWKNCTLGYPVLGRPETIGRVDSGVMREYLTAKYTADNIVVSVAGSFDETELRLILDDAFGELPAGSGTAGAGMRDGPNAVYAADARLCRKETEQIHLCLGFEGIELGDDDAYPLHLVNNLLGGGMSSVLFQKVREELGLVYSIYSYASAYRHAGLYTVYAGMQPENAETVYDMIIGEIEKFKKSGVSADLLERAKDQFKGNFYMGLESPNARMSALGKNELLLGYVNTPEEIIEKACAVTLDDVYRVMEKVFDMDKLAASAVGRLEPKFAEKLNCRAATEV